ncbi:MAG: hypothetical protein AAGA25_08825 [Planctomycetota bacterium]
MSALQKLSKRELWMVSLLPAALVVIASFIVPSPADEVKQLEERLEQITQNTSPAQTIERAQTARAEIREAESTLEALSGEEASVQAQIETARRPEVAIQTAYSASLAENLDELRARLADHGVQVLAIDSKATGKSSTRSRAGASSLAVEKWRVTAVGRWGQVRQALNHSETFPEGLALLSIQMDEPSSRTALRRWELSVAPVGGRP